MAYFCAAQWSLLLVSYAVFLKYAPPTDSAAAKPSLLKRTLQRAVTNPCLLALYASIALQVRLRRHDMRTTAFLCVLGLTLNTRILLQLPFNAIALYRGEQRHQQPHTSTMPTSYDTNKAEPMRKPKTIP